MSKVYKRYSSDLKTIYISISLRGLYRKTKVTQILDTLTSAVELLGQEGIEESNLSISYDYMEGKRATTQEEYKIQKEKQLAEKKRIKARKLKQAKKVILDEYKKTEKKYEELKKQLGK